MIKIPEKYRDVITIIEKIECICQRCEPANRWSPQKVTFDADGELQLPNRCPRCKSTRWWMPYARPAMSKKMRAIQAKNKLSSSS